MTFDDLRKQWQESNALAASQRNRELALVKVCRTVEKTNLSILRRDMLETIAAVAAIGFFGSAMFSMKSWIAIAGTALIVVWAAYVIYKLHRTRTKKKTENIDLSVREYYEQEVYSVDRQIALLRSILWWYLLPCFVGSNLVFSGLMASGDEPFSLFLSGGYFIFTLLLCGGIWWLNQRAVEKTLLPVRKEIIALLDDLQENPDNP